MKKREPMRYYQIKINVFWGIIGSLVILIGMAYFKDEVYSNWLRSRGREAISFEGMQSNLKDENKCFLCGNSNYSIKGHDQQFPVGIISLNDWHVLEFQLKNYDEDGVEIKGDEGMTTRFGNTGEITYLSTSFPARGMASIDITLPDDYNLNTEIIQNNLCQKCLDKVAASLEYRKWKNEKKKGIPLCLIDFKTLEIYSLQDWHRGCAIRDYWIEIEPNGSGVEVNIFYLPG